MVITKNLLNNENYVISSHMKENIILFHVLYKYGLYIVVLSLLLYFIGMSSIVPFLLIVLLVYFLYIKKHTKVYIMKVINSKKIKNRDNFFYLCNLFYVKDIVVEYDPNYTLKWKLWKIYK